MTRATLTLEFDIELEGPVIPYAPANMPSFSDDVGAPAEGGYVEDVTISDLGLVRWVPGAVPALQGRHVTYSLLKGVDTANPEIQKLLGNLLDLIGDDADEALFSAAEGEAE